MDPLAYLNTRVSAIRLEEPGPDAAQLDSILRAGVRAPDHGRLVPWRFIVLEGDGRKQLGNAMARALSARTSDADLLNKEAAKPLRAPCIVTVAAKITAGKIPEIEQVLAAGAAAQNIMLAAHCLGFGAAWKTGGAAYNSHVKCALGLQNADHIVGFIYIGSQPNIAPLREVSLDGLVTRI